MTLASYLSYSLPSFRSRILREYSRVFKDKKQFSRLTMIPKIHLKKVSRNTRKPKDTNKKQTNELTSRS